MVISFLLPIVHSSGFAAFQEKEVKAEGLLCPLKWLLLYLSLEGVYKEVAGY